jgi:hypothetical protein
MPISALIGGLIGLGFGAKTVATCFNGNDNSGMENSEAKD